MPASSPFNASFWDQRYGAAGSHFVFGTAPNDFLAACAALIPAGGPVLCLAEGEGRNAVHLALLGHPVTAVDQSDVGLTKARQFAADQGVADRLTTHVADLADFAIVPGTWAAVVSIFCHLPPALRRDVHARAAAGLRPGGLIILEAYAPEQVVHRTGGPIGAPELLMRLDEVRHDFPGIVWTTAQSLERVVIEGNGHTGIAAVTQLCGHAT